VKGRPARPYTGWMVRSLAALLLILSLDLAAADWPQWRGPSSQGISSETGLPSRWSAQENIAWKAALAGFGASSPIVTGDLVIVTSQTGSYATGRGRQYPHLARDDEQLSAREHAIGGPKMASTESNGEIMLVVEAFRRSDGKRLWQYKTPATGDHQPNHEKHNLATPTPVTDGEHIFAWFGNGQVVALGRDGRELWKRHLGQQYGSFMNDWGHGSSPALYRDLLILLCEHKPHAYLLALDKRTGEERWKVERGKGNVSHSTPEIVPRPTGDEMIVNASERIDAIDPATGKLLWHADGERQTPIPSVVYRDGKIYMSRGYRNSDVLALGKGGEVEWRMPNGASYVPSILLYQGLLYMTNEVGVVTCADAANGQRIWQKRLNGIFFASPVGADGKVYMVSETGETFVLRAGREPEVIATNDLGERFLASPAISGGRIFLRSDGSLFAAGK
jgi:outer membrane protein assembly factor BamB